MPARPPRPRPDAPRAGGLGDVPYLNGHSAPGAAAFTRKEGQTWNDISATQFMREVTALAKGFIAAGIGPGDRVVLAAANRYEWPVVAFAVWAVRGVLVPVHAACSPERLRHVLYDCRPAKVVCERPEHALVVAEAARELHDLGRAALLGESGQGGLEPIVRSGAYMDPSAVLTRREETARSDPALIDYPVSTRRGQRGAVLSHGNLLSAAESTVQALSPHLGDNADPDTLLGVPLAGTLGYSALLACLLAGVRVGFAPPHSRLLNEMRSFRPSVVVAPPRLLERVYALEQDKVRDEGADVLHIFGEATRHAVLYDRSERNSAWRRFTRRMYEWAYTRVRDALGGRAQLVVCAGGTLSARLTHFYGGTGISVVQAFGVTETAGAFTLNLPGRRQVGSVGRPAPGVEVRLSRQGEVHVRGAAVFSGYFRDPDASARAFRQGWLATGVRGTLDPEGFLILAGGAEPEEAPTPADARTPMRAVAPLSGGAPAGGPATGPRAALPPAPAPTPTPDPATGAEWTRQPALPPAAQQPPPLPSHSAPPATGPTPIVLPEGGDPVARLESALVAHPLISQAMVMLQGRPCAGALIVLNRDQVEYWRLVNGRPLSMPLEEVAADPALHSEVQSAVRAANSTVDPAAAIRVFHVLPEQFSPHSGLVTSEGRLRREVVQRAFAEEIDAMYRGAGHMRRT